jgi:hypothetical protein
MRLKKNIIKIHVHKLPINKKHNPPQKKKLKYAFHGKYGKRELIVSTHINGKNHIFSNNNKVNYIVLINTYTICQYQTFSCTTNAGRPSSRIQWYLSTTNITTSASPQPDVCNTDCSDDKVISSRQLLLDLYLLASIKV